MLAADQPDYDPSLSAFHRAFFPELRQIVEHLPLSQNMCVLDVPCGGGFFTRLLADRLGPAGKIEAVDVSPAYLTRTRERLDGVSCASEVRSGDAYALPYPDDSFDLVWCAQSLISLENPTAAIGQMKRVARPGGIVAILENDAFHQTLLPWPVDLEVGIQRAWQLAAKVAYGSSVRLSPARRLMRWLHDAGLESVQRKTFAADRQPPWTEETSRFLDFYLRELQKFVGGHLLPEHRKLLDRAADSQSLFDDETMYITCLNVLHLARK